MARFDGSQGCVGFFCSVNADVLKEIWVRLTLEDIVRCQSVCKDWYFVIKSEDIVERVLRNSLVVVHPTLPTVNHPERDVFLYIMKPPWPCAEQRKEETARLPIALQELILPIGFHRRATLHPQPCHGLWLMYSNTDYNNTIDYLNEIWYSSHDIVVINLSTQDWCRLPRTRRVWGNLTVPPGFGYVSRTQEYKVVSMTMFYDGAAFANEFTAEVVSFSHREVPQEMQWRRVNTPGLNNFRLNCVHGHPVLIDEAIYWLFETCSQRHPRILRFELETEKFRVIHPPRPEVAFTGSLFNCNWAVLVKIQGRLGLLFYEDRLKLTRKEGMPQLVQIWTLEDCIKGVWCKHKTEFDIKDPGLLLEFENRPRQALSISHSRILISFTKGVYLLNICDGSIQLVYRHVDKGFECCYDKSETDTTSDHLDNEEEATGEDDRSDEGNATDDNKDTDGYDDKNETTDDDEQSSNGSIAYYFCIRDIYAIPFQFTLYHDSLANCPSRQVPLDIPLSHKQWSSDPASWSYLDENNKDFLSSVIGG